MKWLAVLAVVSVLAVAALFMRGEPVPAPSSPAASIPPAPRSVAAAPAATGPGRASVGLGAQPWQRIELRGVLFQRNDVAGSQALLSIDGQPVQVFRSGEQVLAGWALQSIQADHVTVANGVDQRRLDVMQPGAGRQAESTPASTPASGNSNKEAPLPGFIPSATPAGLPAPPPSVETNRRFLQDRQNRQSGATR